MKGEPNPPEFEGRGRGAYISSFSCLAWKVEFRVKTTISKVEFRVKTTVSKVEFRVKTAVSKVEFRVKMAVSKVEFRVKTPFDKVEFRGILSIKSSIFEEMANAREDCSHGECLCAENYMNSCWHGSNGAMDSPPC